MKLPDKVEKVYAAVTGPRGHTPSVLRCAVAERAAADTGTVQPRAAVPDDLVDYVDKVNRAPYKVIDRDIEQLQARGYSEQEIFELTVATAVGAAYGRFEKARRWLEETP